MLSRTLRGVVFAFGLLSPAFLFAADTADNGEAPKQLVPPTVWAVISFAVVLFILWKKLIPVITGAMDDRAEKIREAMAAESSKNVILEAARSVAHSYVVQVMDIARGQGIEAIAFAKGGEG